MITLSSCLIWQIISFILPPNEYGCLYACLHFAKWAGNRLTEDADFGKKNHIFRWCWWVGKQAKLLHLGLRKPARIHWKADALKTSHWLVRILIQRHNWAIFLRKWARRGRYNGDRYRAMLNEFLFTKIEEENIVNIWFQQNGAICHTAKATLDVLRPIFEDRIISRRAYVVWPPRSCDLTPFYYYLWDVVKDKCYADKA